jgi:pyruvate formate lyase activating enzyme
VCNTNALEKCGDYMSTEEILSDIISDQEFYKQSGGGITISGGEPLLQYDFLLELLKEIKNANLHVCLDTTGNIESDKLKQIIKYVDIILYDVKTLDDERHISLTGVSNRLILKNLKLCLAENKEIINRIPIIPEYNFIKIEEELSSHIQSLVEMGIKKFELIPYHKFGEQKYKMLGKNYQLSLKGINEDKLLNLVNELKKTYNISIQISKPILT